MMNVRNEITEIVGNLCANCTSENFSVKFKVVFQGLSNSVLFIQETYVCVECFFGKKFPRQNDFTKNCFKYELNTERDHCLHQLSKKKVDTYFLFQIKYIILDFLL